MNESENFFTTVTPATITPDKFDWVFGDGSTRTTTGSETIKVYTSAGTKKVKVTVTATDASTGTVLVAVTVQFD